ncbi:P-loop NTPase fold protein [Ralstonia solanacearum]|uniref:KAP family P-loop NTPase fold protein n=1 Tax=Ralstonia solanacearum TaxID=305 RepID=UPI002F9442C7
MLVLRPSSPGIVVGIEGEWGSGKTTVVRYIVECLRKPGKEAPIVVEFNPWMLAGADALVEALLTELASGIGMDAGKKGAKKSVEAAKKIVGYAGMLRHLKYLKYVPGVSLFGVAAETVGDALHEASEYAERAGKAADDAKKVVEDAEKLVSLKVGLAQRKKEVVKALTKLNKSIVVVVDDLDRLTPEETRAVFRTVKAVADFPRVAYLLAYDRAIVSENIGGGPVSGGAAYIEKIVQVAYPIAPAFPWQLRSHLTDGLGELLNGIGRDLRAFELELRDKAILHACNLCRYPRDIIRLLNRLTLSLASTKQEVNAADVVVAEALFQRFPSIRTAIVRNPERYTGFHWSVEQGMDSTDWSMFLSSSKEERRNAWLESLPSDGADRALATSALRFLFPMLAASGVNSQPRSHLRLSELSRLIRFFALTSIGGVQEVADIEEMLGNPEGVGALLSELATEQATEMIGHFVAYMDGGVRVDYAGVIRQVMRACTGEKLAVGSQQSFAHVAALLVARCLEHCTDGAEKLAVEFVENCPLVYGVNLLLMLGARHGEVRRLAQHKVDEAPLYVTDREIVLRCIDVWRKRAELAFESGTVKDERDLFFLLYGLAHLGKKSAYTDGTAAFRKLCTHVPGGLEYFLAFATPYKEFQPDLFDVYVWDADEMAACVAQSSFADEYAWYIARLRENLDVRYSIEERNSGRH